jgi:hypothetical protein
MMQLEIVNYERLRLRDEDEMRKLVLLGSSNGLFFLDLRGASTRNLLRDLQPIVHAQREFFAQPPDSKHRFASDVEGRG